MILLQYLAASLATTSALISEAALANDQKKLDSAVMGLKALDYLVFMHYLQTGEVYRGQPYSDEDLSKVKNQIVAQAFKLLGPEATADLKKKADAYTLFQAQPESRNAS